ncbi:hypothetical protein ACFO3D_08750 [Virgibacillus kekensis]|uniref:DUF4179 domain-containing protein n=1 Tax=Virgibacillus kekensis TaxID=202261 RepID=A0ABV9DHJ2_9BACI
MDKELNELKDRFEKEIPTSFTARDKQAVMDRINEQEPERGSRHIFPKVMTAAVFATLLFVGVIIANDQLGLSMDGDIPKPAPQNSDSLTAEPEEKEELLLHFTKNREYDSLTFDPETIKSGDVVGEDTSDAMKVTDVSRNSEGTVITFDGLMELTGGLYDSAGKLQFIPNMESTQQLPVATQDLGRLVKAGLLNEDVVRKIFGIGASYESTDELSIVIEQIEYIYSEKGSSINFKVRNAVSAENELDFPRETYETSIKLSEDLRNVYNAYAESLDDTLLKGLKPIDVFKMYFHAENEGDEEVQYALYIKGHPHGTPDKETYFNDPFFADTKAMELNEKEFYKELQKVKVFEEIYLKENEAVVSFDFGSSEGDPMFRLYKNTKLDVWKVGWLPMQ